MRHVSGADGGTGGYKRTVQKSGSSFTKALLSAIPVPNIHAKRNFVKLTGEVTSPIEPKPGCRFMARCPYAAEACKKPQELSELSENHFVSCIRAKEIN